MPIVKYFGRRFTSTPWEHEGVSPLKERIKALIDKESLTAFAERIGVARGTLYAAFEREAKTGEHRLDAETAKRIAEGLGKTVTWVYVNDDGPAWQPPTAPPTRSEPTTEDAMRWRALCELVSEDGASPAEAFEALSTAEFDRSKQQPTWGDYYALAKRRLKRGA